MDPHTVNTMGMHGGMSIPMSIAMAGAKGTNQQAMAMSMNGSMGMNAYSIPQQPQQQHQMLMNMNHMPMGTMAMKMNTNTAAVGSVGMQVAGAQAGVSSADWRIQLTREHRANLIAKIYNEMVRVSADPVPGIKLWMNVSWYELTLYKESRTQEEYINKIFTRLKSLRAQQTDMNAVIAAQVLPNQGMLSRLDFSYYNTLNLNQHAGVPASNSGYLVNPQFGGPPTYSGVQQPQPTKPMAMGAGGMPTKPSVPTNTTPRMAVKPDGGAVGNTSDMTAEYWRQHAALKAKYHDDVEKVHSAFKKYVDHMKGHDETEQKKKLRYLLSYVQLCASILNEDKTTNPPRKIEELDKVYKYIVKIVNPYLKKLRTETDKRSLAPSASDHDSAGGNHSAPTNPAVSGGMPASVEGGTASGHMSNMPNGAMLLQQGHQNMSLQQKQQHYLMQQRHQQMQQRMQAQARQQQMIQHQQLLQQHQKGPSPRNQAQFSAQQNNPPHVTSQSSLIPSSQQSSQQLQQHLAQQTQTQQTQRAQQTSSSQHQSTQSHSQPLASQQSQQTQQSHQAHQLSQLSQQHQQRTLGQQQGQQQAQQQAQQHAQQQGQQQAQHQSHQQEAPPQPHSLQKSQQQQTTLIAHTSRTDTSSLSLDDSLYGGMDSSGLLQMPSSIGSSGPSSGGFINFPNDLSPTNFSSMDLLDMDGFMGQDSNGSSGGGHNNANSAGGNNTNSGDGADSDLMFMEAL